MRRRTPPTRRLILTAIGASLLQRVARTQPAKRHRIATLALGSRAGNGPMWAVFEQGLRALGYGEQDIEIESRWADGDVERLPGLAAELVQLAPEVIVAGAAVAALAAKQATSTIPIVVVTSPDPVGQGLVASLARPGGNVTGLSNIPEELVGKRLELLKTAVPAAERIAALLTAISPFSARVWEAARAGGRALGMELHSMEVRSSGEIDGAFATMTSEHADAVILLGGPLFVAEAGRIADLAASHQLPASAEFRAFPAAGGLMSYGPDLKDMNRRAATYVDKILKGVKPADLPVEQPTKFELVINLKTAKALGVTVPQTLLARADEVIE